MDMLVRLKSKIKEKEMHIVINIRNFLFCF